jgi:hypothetical protein
MTNFLTQSSPAAKRPERPARAPPPPLPLLRRFRSGGRAWAHTKQTKSRPSTITSFGTLILPESRCKAQAEAGNAPLPLASHRGPKTGAPRRAIAGRRMLPVVPYQAMAPRLPARYRTPAKGARPSPSPTHDLFVGLPQRSKIDWTGCRIMSARTARLTTESDSA